MYARTCLGHVAPGSMPTHVPAHVPALAPLTGVYETPGGTILLNAHRAIESITLDRAEMHLKVRLCDGWLQQHLLQG